MTRRRPFKAADQRLACRPPHARREAQGGAYARRVAWCIRALAPVRWKRCSPIAMMTIPDATTKARMIVTDANSQRAAAAGNPRLPGTGRTRLKWAHPRDRRLVEHGVLAARHRQHLVVDRPVLDLLEQRHRLAFDHGAGRKRHLRQHEAVDRRAVVPDGPGHEAVGKGIGGRDLDGAQALERALVVDVLSPGPGFVLDEHAHGFFPSRVRAYSRQEDETTVGPCPVPSALQDGTIFTFRILLLTTYCAHGRLGFCHRGTSTRAAGRKMLHHRGEAEPIAAGSRLRLDTSLRRAHPSRVGETNPMPARVPLKIQRGNSEDPICENEPTCPDRHNCDPARSVGKSAQRRRRSERTARALAHPTAPAAECVSLKIQRGNSDRTRFVKTNPRVRIGTVLRSTDRTHRRPRRSRGETNPTPVPRRAGETNPTATAGCPAW